jgi:hypothetical protein
MAETAPRGQFNRAADFVHPVPDCTAAALNLTTISKKANHAAQRIRFFNADPAVQTVTVTAEVGPRQTPFNVPIPIGPGREYTTEFPISAIVSATSGTGVISAIVMWWSGSTTRINK